MTSEDWAAYNELAEHLPKEYDDPVLIILKGHLLIERLFKNNNFGYGSDFSIGA